MKKKWLAGKFQLYRSARYRTTKITKWSREFSHPLLVIFVSFVVVKALKCFFIDQEND